MSQTAPARLNNTTLTLCPQASNFRLAHCAVEFFSEHLVDIDPPCLRAAHSKASRGNCRHDMSPAGHGALQNAPDGTSVLSGYNTLPYRGALPDWREVTSQKQGSVVRTECHWINPAAQQCVSPMALFDAAAPAAPSIDQPALSSQEDRP